MPKLVSFIKNKPIVLAAPILILAVFYFLRLDNYFSIDGKNAKSKVIYPPHPLTGVRCANYAKRPIAVMLAEDKEARPLSGVSKADIIVEMPVIKYNINRIMAVFLCETPEDIGSVRSARDDFIPIAASFDAIFAHWGGSHFALDELKKGVIDNIDAMINPFNAYYRKKGTYAPHDGFTSYERLKNSAEKLNYSLENKFEGYKHKDEKPNKDTASTVFVGYPSPFHVNYVYSSESNSYFRWRGGKPEKDKLDDSQVESKVIIVMFTNSRQLDRDYNDVTVVGEGKAFIFQNGDLERIKWYKDSSSLNSKLKFLNDQGEEISFVAGKIWIHIVDYGTKIRWGDDVVN